MLRRSGIVLATMLVAVTGNSVVDGRSWTGRSGSGSASRPAGDAAFLDAPGTRTVVLTATEDAYLRDGAPHQNQGGENLLRIRSSGRSRALIRFDNGDLAEALAGNSLVSAHLELEIRTNGGNWREGRAVDAHRLTANWTESATTWSCPADANLGNHQPDCAEPWDGGSFEPAATASVLHTNDLSGWVRFDVTADVEAALAGLPFEGWLLKKANEAAAGLVDYSSREVCGEEPRLVLEIEAPGADTMPPRLAITSPPGRFLINQPTPPLRVSFFDAGSPVNLSSLQVALDGADLTSTCSICQASATCPSPTLAEGSHTLTTRLADAAGNVATESLQFDLLLGDGEHRLTLPAVADTYLRDGAPNQAQGGDTLLRIRSSGKNRALVRFDLDGVEELVDDLHSATLQLYIETNGNNWGTSGRTVSAHALGAGWTEAGATWNCAVDSNPANAQPNCTALWNGGTFDATPTDTLLVTNNLAGWVSFDVTADVLGALAGESHQGWLIKKTNEGQSGLAEFSSKEGTAGRAPRLVLVFDGGDVPDTEPPTLSITAPAEGSVLDDPLPDLSFAFADDASGADTATLSFELNGSPLAVSCSFTGTTASCVPADLLADGTQTLTATIADRAGNVSAPATVHFTIDTQPHEQPLPPDPATVAPPLDRTVATDMASATAFLYSGDDPIQTGVASGTIEPRRVAVLRGRVLARGGAALPGVRITVLDHAELGSTLSRADGAFDLAVNGGGVLTVQYEKTGHLTAQRQIAAPWRDYAHLDDVVLLPLDAAVTTVTAGSPVLQVARGSAVEDEDGRRRPTLVFLPGFTADMVKADGTRSPLAALSVRATEYTQGAEGPRAMPGPLPPTVAYTWAVELSVDEALAAGAERVELSEPAILYLENFLSFPVGGAVPAGSYDRRAASWIGSEDGRIISILGVDGQGLALLDLDGNGQPAVADDLAALSITDAERRQLATLYAPGQSLWRIPIPHFTPWDLNWPYGPPPDAEQPPEDDLAEDEGAKDDENDCTAGSVIECQSQVLGESVPLVGTPFALGYRSDEAPGRTASYTAHVKLSGSTVPASLKRIELEVEIAGRHTLLTFPPDPDQRYTFTWDGRDAYGRLVQGPAPLSLTKTWVYDPQYMEPGALVRSWARFPGGTALRNGRAGSEIRLSRERLQFVSEVARTSLGGWDARALGLGVWRLSVHHSYDPEARTLFLGSGRRRSASSLPPLLYRAAGLGVDFLGDSGDGGPAELAQINQPAGIAVGPDGSLFIADRYNHRIRKVSAGGIISTVAGDGTPCEHDFDTGEAPCGDGVPAASAHLREPEAVAVGPDGSLWIADTGNNCVRKVDRSGLITTVAGVCDGGFDSGGGEFLANPPASRPTPHKAASGTGCDDCPAGQATLKTPLDLAVAPDGGVYVADFENDRIRYITPDGWITTVAGGGGLGDPLGDGGPALGAQLFRPAGIALARDGSLYVAQPLNERVRRIGPNGIITTVAGSDSGGFCGDGGPASAACLSYPSRVAVAPDGGLLIADTNNRRVRRVTPDGRITTVAGNPAAGTPFSTNGQAAAASDLDFIDSVAAGPDGSFYLGQSGAVLHNSFALTGFSEGEIPIPSPTGEEVYIFDRLGRHLETVDPLTRATRYLFTYDEQGLLTGIRDGDGNLTRVERDGQAVAVISPFGVRTRLTLGDDGYLDTIENPAGEQTKFTYWPGGLIESSRVPRGYESHYDYAGFGSLVRAEDRASAAKTLIRHNGLDGLYTVDVTSAMGRRTRYQVERGEGSSLFRATTGPSGLVTMQDRGRDGSQSLDLPDGTQASSTPSPDPRWGLLAPFAGLSQLSTPSGLSRLTSARRLVLLSDPNDPLSLESITDTVTVNGHDFLQTYDAASRRMTLRTPENREMQVTLNAKGRPAALDIPGVEQVDLGYDSFGRLASMTQGTGDERRAFTFEYDPEGRIAKITDPLSRNLRITYDGAGRPEQQILPDGRTISFTYDANGNLTSLTPPGRPAHGFSFTPVDLAEAYAPPTVGVEPAATTYSYNPDQQLTHVSRPDGKALDVAYDTGGRPETVTFSRGELGYSYDAATGHLATVTAPGGETLGYTYDGFLPTQTAWSGPISGTVTRAYDSDFRVTSRRVNGANPIDLHYDRDGLLVQAGALILDRDATNGRLTGTTLGQITTTREYNDFGEVILESASVGSTEIYTTTYERDKLGRITEKTDAIGGVMATFGYSYDLAGRLTDVTRDGTNISHYDYDANSNRTLHETPAETVTATHDSQDRLLTYGDQTFTYTANGDLATRTQNGQTVTYDYDELGNLRSVDLPDGISIKYVIDGQNRRIGKKVNGTLVQGFLYQDQLKPVAELDGAGNVVARFVYASRSNAPDLMIKGGQTYRILTDHLGSPRLVVNVADGTVAQRMDYDEFGGVVLDTNPGLQPFGFAGGLYERQTGLIRFGARSYDPETARWTFKDPIGFGGGGTNFYVYVVGDPVNRLDPSGLFGVLFGSYMVGWGDPNLAFDNSSWAILGDAAAATADGVIPFADPFADTYNSCDGALRLSKALGAFSRDVALSALIPNLSAWAENPVLYEIGQKTLPAARWAELEALDPVARGARIVAEDGWLQALMPSLTPASYAPTIGTGLTPGGWLTAIVFGQAADSATW